MSKNTNININNLPPKQALFVKEYLKDLNATQAYLRAGYKWKKGATVVSSQLLANPKIQAIIKAELDKRTKEIDIDWVRVLQQLKDLALICLQKKTIKKYNHETNEYDEVYLPSVDSAWANTALATLWKYFNLFNDKVEHKHVIIDPKTTDIQQALVYDEVLEGNNIINWS